MPLPLHQVFHQILQRKMKGLETLREQLKNAGLTQQHLADASGIHRNDITDFFAGRIFGDEFKRITDVAIDLISQQHQARKHTISQGLIRLETLLY